MVSFFGRAALSLQSCLWVTSSSFSPHQRNNTPSSAWQRGLDADKRSCCFLISAVQTSWDSLNTVISLVFSGLHTERSRGENKATHHSSAPSLSTENHPRSSALARTIQSHEGIQRNAPVRDKPNDAGTTKYLVRPVSFPICVSLVLTFRTHW